MRVLITDDQALFRRGLKEALTEAFSKVTFGEASTAKEAIRHVRRQNWDLVILDIGMTGKGGLETLSDLRRLRPKLPVLLLCTRAEQFGGRALNAGAAGYLTKDCLPTELKEAIKRIVAGEQYVSTAVTEALAEDPKTGAKLPLYALLSDREFQVLRMIASGKTIKNIAEELSLNVKTVSTYRSRILEKTRMKATAELIRYALLTHLVD